MLVASGFVLGLNMLLSLVVGLRILRAPTSGGPHPERLLSLYFLLGAFLGNITSSVAYIGWAVPALGLSLSTTTALNASSLVGGTLGSAGVYLFTAKTFHGGNDVYARRATRAAWAAILLMLGVLVAEGAMEGFAIRIVVGPLHWLGFSLRVLAFAGAGLESLRYYAASKKRLRLGLSEPIVTNRFLLWGIWSITTGLLLSSELLARAIYLVTTGDAALTAQAITTVAQPLILVTVVVTAALGSVAVTLLFLTFFPTHGFRRWLENSSRLTTEPAAVGLG
jgi:hypothetical protein